MKKLILSFLLVFVLSSCQSASVIKDPRLKGEWELSEYKCEIPNTQIKGFEDINFLENPSRFEEKLIVSDEKTIIHQKEYPTPPLKNNVKSILGIKDIYCERKWFASWVQSGQTDVVKVGNVDFESKKVNFDLASGDDKEFLDKECPDEAVYTRMNWEHEFEIKNDQLILYERQKWNSEVGRDLSINENYCSQGRLATLYKRKKRTVE